MDPQVQQLLELLNWKSFYGISDNAFASLQTILKTNIPTGNALQEENDSPQMPEMPSPLVSKSKRAALFFLRHFTGLQPRYYDCCPRSCCAFTGDHSDAENCPCGVSRYISLNEKQISRKQFCYLPLISRLLIFYSNSLQSKLYQTYPMSLFDSQHQQGGWHDCWDGTLFREHVNSFQEPRHLVFGFFTDGVQVVRQKTHDIWPLLLIQLNLPPKVRYKKRNLILLGIIPGPKQPSDFESFFQPMLDEFKRLEQGVQAWDGHWNEWFTLTASLLQIAGDQPAIASVMGMKGPRGKHPCRMYSLAGIRLRTGYYYPLQSPTNVPPNLHRQLANYDPLHLPYRRHL